MESGTAQICDRKVLRPWRTVHPDVHGRQGETWRSLDKQQILPDPPISLERLKSLTSLRLRAAAGA